MLPRSLIRYHVISVFPTLDKYAIAAITERVHKFAYSEADLVPTRIQGAGEAYLRHERTNYDEQLRAHASHYYDGSRKMFQESARKQLKLRYGI